MSGDVQPRKRKDKKRKRDEDSVPLSFYPKDLSEDINIHVHKDEGTGGGLCAKIVFFLLFSALIVLIGLIITEHRGLTDLDVAESESKYSQIFEGWVDKHDGHTLDDHDNEQFDDNENPHGDGHTLDDHDDDDDHIDDEPSEEQEHTLDDHDDEHFDDDDDTSQTPSYENEEEEPSKEEEEKPLRHRYRREMYEEEKEEKENESQPDDDTEEEEVIAESETKEDEENESETRDEDEDENFIESKQYSEDDAEENDDDLVSEEGGSDVEDQSYSEEDDRGEDEDGENEEQESEVEKDIVENGSEEDREYRSAGENVDHNVTSDEEVQKQEKYEEQSDQEIEAVQDDQKYKSVKEDSSDNSATVDSPSFLNMIVKAIIGASILAVGHFVLVKKWKSDSSEDDSRRNFEGLHVVLSRRNTLIPPPTLQEIEQEVENASEEFSYEDEEPEINEVMDIAREKYEHLRQSYSRSISPESDEKERNEEDIEDFEEEELEEEVEEEEEDVEIEDENQEEEIDDEEYDDDEYEEEDDDALMKKLEAKYGKLKVDPKGIQVSTDQDDSDSDKLSEGTNEYEYSTITNEDDWIIQKELDEAQANLPSNAAKALKMFEKILEKYPSSPRGLYGLATALDNLAEIKKSNELLEEAVANYLKISSIINVPDQLFKTAMERCVDRLKFRGKYGTAVTVHFKLIERFPEEVKYRNHLVVLYLTMGRDQQARLVLEETLRKWPNDGCALVHYGFIWKTAYSDLKKGVYYMKKGIESNDPCAIDGRFFFHLGDALFRLGYENEALKLYENGVEHKLFLSKYQRSLYNVPHLTARPWWNEYQLDHYKLLFEDLKQNWRIIRDEGLSVLNEKGYFQDESENLLNTGEWKQFELFARGRKHTKNCHKTPTTCRIIESHPFASGCRRGQTKFSVMHPGTHVWAHCGPTNCRLRIHLGLKVPPQTFIRVCNETRGWKDGKLLIFDDSFEHEVWHNGTDIRLVLIVDVWHPELSFIERETLSSL